MWSKIKEVVDRRLIKPIRDSHAPVSQISLATAVGLFWALTPLVGIQMMLIGATWTVFRLFRLRFSLPIGAAWAWLTNPFTIPPLFYAFYYSGVFLFRLLGQNLQAVSFATFETVIFKAMDMSLLDGSVYWVRYMVEDLGWPMLAGSFLIGVPIAILGYPICTRLVNGYRRNQAQHEGLTLAEWEARHVYHKQET